MFEKARLKLTLLYLAIIVLISGTFSGLFYSRTTQILETEFERIEHRLQRQSAGLAQGKGSAVPNILPEDITEAKELIATQLLIINGYIILVFTTAGYFLAGKTLEPISRAMEEQKRFVADAAHELKTPITALKTSLEVNLMNKKLGKTTHKILKENLEDISGLESLTEGLLKLARIDEQTLSLEPISLKIVLDKSLKRMSPIASKKAITISATKVPNSLTVKGNENSLVELLTIFIDNSIKYSPRSTKINIQVKSLNNKITIAIKDKGIGISANNIPHIFERFYQVEEARSKKDSSGYGLGLSVAKKIIQEHNGEVEVQSTPNKGTSFTISLPKA